MKYNLYRCLCDAPIEIPCAIAMTTLFAGPLGLQFPLHVPTRLTIAIGIIYWITESLPKIVSVGNLLASEYVSSNVGCSFFLFPALVAYAKFYKKQQVTAGRLKWYVTVVLGTFGAWNNVIIILVIYLTLYELSGVLASIFLSMAFASSELLIVKLLSHAYVQLVMAPRSTDPMALIGDQKQALTMCVVCTHAFTELGRLLCLMVGAIRADSWSFLGLTLLSLFVSCFTNAMVRTLWFHCLVARWIPRVGKHICPTSVTALHNDAKYPMGWLRFASAWGLFLGRGLIHGNWSLGLSNWSLNVPLQDNTVWCFNLLVFFTVLLCMAAELLEDVIVHYLQDHKPAPVWTVFSMQMVARFGNPRKEDIYHPDHLLVPCVPPQHMTASDDFSCGAVSQGRRTLAAAVQNSEDEIQHGLSKHGRCSDLLPALTASPNLKHARTIHTMQIQSVSGASLVLAITALSVGLGNGVAFGHCPFSVNSKSSSMWANLFVFQRRCPEV